MDYPLRMRYLGDPFGILALEDGFYFRAKARRYQLLVNGPSGTNNATG
jgi:hypothetical protein